MNDNEVRLKLNIYRFIISNFYVKYSSHGAYNRGQRTGIFLYVVVTLTVLSGNVVDTLQPMLWSRYTIISNTQGLC